MSDFATIPYICFSDWGGMEEGGTLEAVKALGSWN